MQLLLKREQVPDYLGLVLLFFTVANVLASALQAINLTALLVSLLAQLSQGTFASGQNVAQESLCCFRADHCIVIMPDGGGLERKIRRILPIGSVVPNKHHRVEDRVVARNLGGQVLQVFCAPRECGGFDAGGLGPYGVHLGYAAFGQVLQALWMFSQSPCACSSS